MEETDFLKNVETPCFILDRKELVRNIRGFYKAMSASFKEAAIGYSVKTNSTPYCLCLANDEGCFAEVVSLDEYQLALRCGFNKDHIIYNGPMKSKETFLDAIQNAAIVNIETKRELEWLRDLPVDRKYQVGIRLNINISQVSHDDADGENDNSRFGFSDETDEFLEALMFINNLANVHLSGLHIHRTAHSRSVRFYKNSIRYACEIIEKYRLKLDYLDVGGGYYGIFRDKPTYYDYANGFKDVLSEYDLDGLQIIVEPGNALVASCFTFVSEVIDVKHVEPHTWFITTDGTRNDIDPFFRKTDYIKELMCMKMGETVPEQVVSGCTCLEYDRLFTLDNKPLLSVGDRIVYKNVGAYTMCLSPLFIRLLPKVYMKDNGDYYLVRDNWTAEEVLQKCRL